MKLASGIDESASVVVDYGMVSLMARGENSRMGSRSRRLLCSITAMREVEHVTEMRDPCTCVRTGRMRECRDHRSPSCHSVILRRVIDKNVWANMKV